jgi:Tfp pilus assembly protein PilF
MPQVTINQAMQLAVQNHQAGKLPEAEAVYRQVLNQQPNNPQALHLLGVIAAQVGKFDMAIDLIRRAIASDPTVAGFHNNLGSALYDSGLLDQAAAAYHEALRLKPDYGEAYNHLGCVYLAEGNWQLALETFRKALELQPKSAATRWNYSRVLLTLGHWEQGWAEFDSRLKMARLGLNRGFPQPQWDGSDPSGKTILLHAEGGRGDALNFIRFVPQVAQRGAKLILECQPALVTLFDRLPGLDRVIARGQPLPEVDWHIPLQGLPHVLRITVENVPNKVPYLWAPADRVRKWADRLAGQTKLRVGLVWAGMKHPGRDWRTRTIDIFAPLAEVPGVKFFSLQTGEDSRQAPPNGMDWADFSTELNDFAETAALVQNLDLVVSVDTSVAHLAGALAKPVWVLIPLQSDFRWLLERTDTPWYPTMRLFRQRNKEVWTDVIEHMAQALGKLRDDHSNLPEQRKTSG